MESARYRDFTIHVSRFADQGQQYSVRLSGLVLGGTPGYDDYETCHYAPDVFVLQSNGRSVNLLDMVATGQSTKTQMHQLGTVLSDLILPGTIRERLHESLRIVREHEQRLRLRLIIEAPQLRALPWEYLYLPTTRQVSAPDDWGFLALQPDISIARCEVVSLKEPPFDRKRPYRLLSASAQIHPQAVPALEARQDAVAQVVRTLGDLSVHTKWIKRITRQSLAEVLREPADIFHLISCGDFDAESGNIVLDQEDGLGGDPYAIQAFAGLLVNAHVRLAVLSAWETNLHTSTDPWMHIASVLVRAGLAAVVTHRYALEDAHVPLFAGELYKSVLGGHTIDEAITNARLAIYRHSGLTHRDWASPALSLRAEDGVIFPTPDAPGGQRDPVLEQQVVNNYFIVTQNINQLHGGGSVVGIQADSIGGQPGQNAATLTIPGIKPTPFHLELVGRDDELEQAQEAAAEGQKYYFYGAYGVGKTSLAAELFLQLLEQRTFADGCLWLQVSNLAAEQALESVATYFDDLTVAKAQGREQKVNALRALLAQRPDCLIGLDEVKDAQVARAFLDAAGKCVLILNGLRRAGVSERAKELPVEPLYPDEAARLFTLLAHLNWDAMPPEQHRRVDMICKKMGYLPLAIKLAALTYAEVGYSLENLWQRLQVVPTTIIPDHEEVSAIFDAAYANIRASAIALQMLVRMAFFPALNTPVAALREDELDPEYFLAKDKLLALGLVSQSGPDRLALHPLLGLLARTKSATEDADVSQREETWVAEWLLAYAAQYQDDYVMLNQEHDNLLGIFTWLKQRRERAKLITLTAQLFDYLRVRGHWQEALDCLADAAQAAHQLEQPCDQAWIRCYEGTLRTLQGRYELAQDALAEADHLYEGQDDVAGRGRVLFRQGIIAALTGDLHQARQHLEKALIWMGEQAPIRDIAAAREQLAAIIATQGDPDLAQEQYMEALALGCRVGNKEIQARLHRALGQLHRRAGDYAAAETHYQAAITFSDQLGYVHQTAVLNLEWGYLLYYQGKYEEAMVIFQDALAICKGLDYAIGEAAALHALGNVTLVQGAFDEAKAWYEAALTINQRLRNAMGSASNQYQMGVIAHRQGELTAAEALYRVALDAATSMQVVGLQAACWHQLGRVAVGRGQWTEAWEAAECALCLAEQAQARLTQVSALTLLGSIQAHNGDLATARENLEEAREAYQALNAPEAMVVEPFLNQLKNHINVETMDIPIDINLESAISFSTMHIDVIVEAAEMPLLADEAEQEFDIDIA
jgi:tetratricopeptide (TPR) repeat protein